MQPLHLEWINDRVLLWRTGNCVPSPGIKRNGNEYKGRTCVCVCAQLSHTAVQRRAPRCKSGRASTPGRGQPCSRAPAPAMPFPCGSGVAAEMRGAEGVTPLSSWPRGAPGRTRGDSALVFTGSRHTAVHLVTCHGAACVKQDLLFRA